MRVLVITRSAWRESNNTGSTMSNFFSDMPKDCAFYGLSCRSELPDNPVARKSFQISEYALLKNLLTRKPVGTEVVSTPASDLAGTERKIYRRSHRLGRGLTTLFRELVWTFGNWKSKALDDFLEDVQPDILFMTAFESIFPYKILRYIQKKTGAAVVLFHADTNYTLKQFSLSPFYWIERLAMRKYIRRAVAESALNYSITQEQGAAYTKKFHKPFYWLTKSEDFLQMPAPPTHRGEPVQLVYTGNIDSGRMQSLLLLLDALREINRDRVRAQLHIYAGIVQNPKKIHQLCVPGVSFFHGEVPVKELEQIYREADILVYTEGLDLRSRLKVREAFSSKLVDYFFAARCIFAVGPKDIAPVAHLLRTDAAVVASSPDEVRNQLKALVENSALREAYAEKAWRCGAEHHNSKTMKKQLYEQLSALTAQK